MNRPHYVSDVSTGYMPGLVIPSFKSRRDETHWKVRHLNLSALDRETRQAAAADPSIFWDAEARQYRPRRRNDPLPVESVGQYLDPADAADTTPAPQEGAGALKVSARPPSRPAATNSSNANRHSGVQS